MIDATAMEVMNEINRDLAVRDIRLSLAEIKGPVQDRLMRSPIWKNISGNIYLSANTAYEEFSKRLKLN